MRGKLVVRACCASAAQRGVTPGMPLAEAKAIVGPTLRVGPDPHAERGVYCEPHEPKADYEALQKLALWAQRFSPLVAVHEPDCLLLDVTGCGPLFGGELKLAEKALRDLHRQGYAGRAAVADTIGAAWAVAHYGTADAAVVLPGQHSDELKPLPVESLRLDEDVIQLLRAFDIRRIDQLLELPRAALPSRFGPELLRRLDQALGDVAESLTFERAHEPDEATWEFEVPCGDRRVIEAVLEKLLEQVLEKLRPRQMGVQRLLCWLHLVQSKVVGTLRVPSTTDGTRSVPTTFLVGLLHASASMRHLLELVRLHLERVQLPAEVARVMVRASAAPLDFHQGQMFGEENAERWREFPVLVERLCSRLGEKAVLRPSLRADAQPELAWRYESWLAQWGRHSCLPDAEGRQECLPHALLWRPPCLKAQPVAVPVMSVVPGGPPLRFEWQGHSHVVAHYWGPERIETGWWRGPDVRRDYYLVETATGERFWLFRTRQEEAWFLHGAFG